MSLERVASIDEARRYRCYPGSTVYLLDQERPMIYMKSCDQSGNPSLRAFSLTEVDAGSGYFEAEATVTFTGSAGLAAISLLNDGTAIPGASASATIGTADAETHTLSFACEVLKTPCRPRMSLSLASTGVAITVTSVAVRVKRDA